MSKERISWVDGAKGWAILLVVLGHVLANFMSSGIFTGLAAKYVHDFIYSFHMPLFFFISGYLHEYTSNGKNINLRKKVVSTLLPYVVFSILYWFTKYFLSFSTNNPVSFSDLALIFIKPIGEYWFLYALLIFYIADYLLRWLCNGKGKSRTIIGALLFFILAIIYGSAKDMAFVGQTIIGRVMKQGLYFFTGIFMCYNNGRFKYIFKLHIALPIFAILETIYLQPTFYSDWVGNLLFVAVASAGTGFFIALFNTVSNKKWIRPLEILGKGTMQIYLLHVYFIVLSKIVLCKFIPSAFICAVLNFLISVYGSYYVYHYIINKIKPIDILLFPQKYINV